jgi:hypothetical protein
MVVYCDPFFYEWNGEKGVMHHLLSWNFAMNDYE